MPSDLFTLKPLAAELNDALKGGKIDKITQPEKDEIRLHIRAFGNNYTLLISANPEAPRIHLATDKRPNPITAPAFCMHLRKHISGFAIDNIRTLDDRVVEIKLSGRTELKDKAEYRLYVEIMNRYSNIVLVTSDGRISDAIKRISFDEGKRGIISGAIYVIPSQPDKPALSDGEGIKKLLSDNDGGDTASLLTRRINGVSRITVNELLLRAGYDCGNPTEEGINSLIRTAKEFDGIYESQAYCPCNSDGDADFFAMPYLSLGGNFHSRKSLSEAVERHFELSRRQRANKQLTSHLVTAAVRYENKLNKKLGDYAKKLEECENMELYRLYGELLTANLYRLKKGDTSAEVQNYYDESCPVVSIPLDENLTPQQNAANYFRKYNKLKRTRTNLTAMKAECEKNLDYVKSLKLYLKTCDDRAAAAELEKELVGIGALKAVKKPSSKIREQAARPLEFFIDGIKVVAGKNNIQNEELTFRTADRNHIWLHVKNYHGSHVIIFAENPSEEIIVKAAAIAAALSEAADNGKAEVDYTVRRNVRKIPGGLPGMVNYTDYKTVTVIPSLPAQKDE